MKLNLNIRLSSFFLAVSVGAALFSAIGFIYLAYTDKIVMEEGADNFAVVYNTASGTSVNNISMRPERIDFDDFYKHENKTSKNKGNNLYSIPENGSVFTYSTGDFGFTFADPYMTSSISSLEGRISSIESRIRALSDTILETPEKAIQFRLLKKEIESIGEKQKIYNAALVREISRVFDTIKWVIGTIIIGILGIIVSIYLNRRSSVRNK